MDENIKTALQDMLTIANIGNFSDYFEALSKATRECQNLGINSSAEYTIYSQYFELFRQFSFNEMTFIERMSDSEYKFLLTRTYKDLTGIEIRLPIEIKRKNPITTQEVRNALSDLKTLAAINNDASQIDRLKDAIADFNCLKVRNMASYYIFQSYVASFKGISYEQIGFFERVEDEEYKKQLERVYKKITGIDFVSPERSKIITFPNLFSKKAE